MFQKHIYVTSTGDPRERNDGTNYYVIWETSIGRPIYPEGYAPYLDWIAAGNAPDVVDITPTPVETSTDLTLEHRIDALENSFLEDMMSRLV